VVNLRGAIVPIVDLRIKFATDDCAYEGSTVTIVLTVAGRVVGMVVDAVSDVVQLELGQIKLTDAIDADHLLGIGAVMHGDQERMLILVDVEQLMTAPGMGLAAQTPQ